MTAYATVGGLRIAYREAGRGPGIVLLHGNPTSSYLWRDVLPVLSRHGRCVAPDLLGMGDSDPLPDPGPGRYRFVDQQRMLDGLLDQLDLGPVVLVGHDWGGVLAVDRARRHPGTVRGIAYLETLVSPLSWSAPNAPAPELFRALRGPAGERLVLEENVFIESVLQAGTLRRLGETELAAYRRPFGEPGESRRPMLTWAREIPLDGEPADVHAVAAANAAWMAGSDVPKLFVNGEPGALLTGPSREECRRWPNQVEVTVPGLHFLPEDSSGPIAAALSEWLGTLEP